MTTAGNATAAGKKKIVLVAGRKSHPFGQHAHNTGALLLAKELNESSIGVDAVVHRDGWPADESIFNDAASIVLYMDGGDRHPAVPHLKSLDALMKKGVGLACLHYAVEVPKGEAGDRFLDWIGGYFEVNWSVNPIWHAHFDKLPNHPITRGVKPFHLRDEWYFHMRFRENMRGITPILSAIPPDELKERAFGPRSGNAAIRERKGMPEHMAWAYDRPSGGRGFGFTGGHYFWAFGDNNLRNIVLNGIAWTAGIDVPSRGVTQSTLTFEDLMKNQEGAMPEGFNRETATALIMK